MKYGSNWDPENLLLDFEEKEKIYRYALEFLEHKEGKSIKQGSGSDFEYDLLGFTAEYIAHKQLGIPFNWNFDRKYRLDDIVFKDKNGRSYVGDVKGSYYSNELHISKWKWNDLEKIDALLLVTVSRDFWSGRIIGIISSKRFKTLAKLKTYNSEMYCVDAKYLTKVEDVI